ncbi:hypothetical protein [Sediminicoccus rosea]|uniref:Tetratricopeptide repeat-containing protein n=1 Tax=Sediminicoccus rosea TaxID=1225128 RepID=A0ABZ0PB66_9PROT|nr:hypothetical protein [Sediminicoccus rosea]WPB82934.1 hypothetical protein R9Z33_12540 [Sediminicoccus rosea]
MRPAALALGLALLALPVAAQERVGVRTGDHPGHGRIVFDWAAAPAYQVEQQGDRVILRFPNADAIDLAGARRLPRNILAVAKVPGGVELTLRPGSRIRHFRNGPKVALDALDPSETREATAPRPPAEPPRAAAPRPVREVATRPATAPPAATSSVSAPPASAAPASAPASVQPEPTRSEPPRAEAARAEVARLEPPRAEPARVEPARAEAARAEAARAEALRPEPTRTEPPRAEPARAEAPRVEAAAEPPRAPPRPAAAPPPLGSLAGPPPVRARLLDEPGIGPGMRLPLGAGSGLAAFRRGEQALILAETERPIEFGGLLREPAFQGIQARPVPGATLITFPLALGQQLALRHEGNDWFLSVVPRQHPAASATPTLRAEFDQGRAILHAPRPGRVLSLPDPLTGGPLLVGLVTQAGPRQLGTRGLAELDLLETFLGVAVLARADRVALRPGAGRFLLSIEGGSVSLAAAPDAMQGLAPGMTRSFDMPAQPMAALLERLRAQQAGIASAPPLTRAEPRLAAAQTLLALGLPQEAQAMLRLAAQESPEAAMDRRLAFLGGMAALLAGRPGEAAGLDAEIPGSDEVLLWRSLRAAMQGDAQAAGPGLAAAWPLLQAYPEGLRRRVVGPAAEALVEGGQHAAARRLIEAMADDPAILLAQAMLEEAQGEPARALEAYAAAAQGRDRLMRARALRRGIELRLATGRLDAAGAARALESALFAWRGDGIELTTRERVAALRREAGDPRGALALLRETAEAFPEQAAQLRAPIQSAFLHALETESPLGAVALADAHPELLPSGEAGEGVLAMLTERLVALDLADRASALLRRAMEHAPAGEHRAALGARLAALRLSERDAEGTLAALAASSAPRLPHGLVETRSLLAARAEARRGNRALAAEALQALGPAGDEALSEILAEARDFNGAAAALGRHLATLPASGPLPESAQRLLLRQAAWLAMAGDQTALAQLRARHGAQIASSPLASAFEMLATDPVRGLADLPRLARELNLFRSLPQRLEPLRTAQGPAG